MSEHYDHNKQITAAILKDIEEYKVHIAFIDSDGYNPRFGYSIGLFKRDLLSELWRICRAKWN
jgi:hypothetical protein